MVSSVANTRRAACTPVNPRGRLGELLWKTTGTSGIVLSVSFRPTAADRLHRAWARRHTHRRTVQRAATVTCLALGAIGGLGTLAGACSPDTSVTAEQMAVTLNRSVAVEGFADAFINAYLSGAKGPTALPLTAFTSVSITAPPVPVSVIKTAPWSARPQDSGYANIDYWSVVIGAFVKPLGKSPQLWFYQVPVAVVDGAPRVTSAPAFLNGPPPGYDPELAYPVDVLAHSAPADTVAGFLESWLSGTGDITRYSTAPGISTFPETPFTRITSTSLKSTTEIPTQPAEGFSTQVLATITAQDRDRITQTLSYPLTISYRTNKWFVTDIDLAPKLGGRLSETAATTAANTPTTTPPYSRPTLPR